jgi:D-aminopeptidase
LNAITDVPGVEVGCTTIIEGDGPVEQGVGPIRTGVTAILPRGHAAELAPVWAGLYSLNGNGEMTGSHWIHDGGYFLSPILISNTHAIGMCHHACVGWMIDHYQRQYLDQHLWAMPVVAETYDGATNDINGRHVQEHHVRAALDSASGGAVAEGNTGGGTGMVCYGFKGGTGTSSRVFTLDAAAGRRCTVGALVQANYGRRADFVVRGVPVGADAGVRAAHAGGGGGEADSEERERGSIIVVLGTDAPLMPHQLDRLARRAAIGIGRGGSPGGNGSGDIFLAFSTANPAGGIPTEELGADRFPVLHHEYMHDDLTDALYLAGVEAVEEAVLNAVCAAEPLSTVKPAGNIVPALDHAALQDVLRRHNMLGSKL